MIHTEIYTNQGYTILTDKFDASSSSEHNEIYDDGFSVKHIDDIYGDYGCTQGTTNLRGGKFIFLVKNTGNDNYGKYVGIGPKYENMNLSNFDDTSKKQVFVRTECGTFYLNGSKNGVLKNILPNETFLILFDGVAGKFQIVQDSGEG